MVEKNFGKIGILMGGPSTEREISLKSGKAVLNILEKENFDVVPLDIISDNLNDAEKLIRQSRINLAFIALHGRFGEDGTIQNLLEELQLPYTGSGVEASKLAMDKVASREIFKAAQLSIPNYLVLDGSAGIQGNSFDYPLVVKPATHGSSIGLSLVLSRAEFRRALDTAFQFDNRVIVEEYLKGREFTVGILDETALPVIEIRPKRDFFDFEAKYTYGMTDYIIPAKIDGIIASRMQRAALLAHRSLGCFGCSRADIILGAHNKIYVLEVNSIPGLTEASLLPKAARYAGIDFLQLCIRLIELAYEKTENKVTN